MNIRTRKRGFFRNPVGMNWKKDDTYGMAQQDGVKMEMSEMAWTNDEEGMWKG